MISGVLVKIVDFAKTEKRLVRAGIFLFAVFLLNYIIFSSQTITPEDCQGGKCVVSGAEKPQLSKDNNFFYVDDILADTPSGYYRLTFQTQADQEEGIRISLNTYTEKNQTIGNISTGAAGKLQNQELFFFLPEGFDSLLFEKENTGAGGNIFLKGVGISKLNIDSAEEFASMQKTIITETVLGPADLGQTETYSESFDFLHEPKMTLGQVFKAEDDYISGISFNMDIVKKPDAGGKQYDLGIWKVRCDAGDCQTQGEVMAKISFSVANDLEKFRQADGTFRFPLYANVEKGQSYFVGIDNSAVKVDRKNYLNLRGSRDDDSYPDGSAGMKQGRVVYKVAGDLFFAVHGAKFDVREGKRMLNGAKIESLGKGQGKYTYAARGEFLDILDLRSASPGIEFDEKRNLVVGSAKNDSFMEYEVNTLYPIRKINFSAEQAKSSWKRVKVEYSFDRQIWNDIPSLEKNSSGSGDDPDAASDEAAEAGAVPDVTDQAEGKNAEKSSVQAFDFEIIPKTVGETVYFRISPDPEDEGRGRNFALKNLLITADLNMK